MSASTQNQASEEGLRHQGLSGYSALTSGLPTVATTQPNWYVRSVHVAVSRRAGEPEVIPSPWGDAFVEDLAIVRYVRDSGNFG